MYVGKIEAAEEIQLLLPENQPDPAPEGKGAMILGISFLIVALPYWGLRLFGEALWRDVRRAGRVVKVAGATYGEEIRRR